MNKYIPKMQDTNCIVHITNVGIRVKQIDDVNANMRDTKNTTSSHSFIITITFTSGTKIKHKRQTQDVLNS